MPCQTEVHWSWPYIEFNIIEKENGSQGSSSPDDVYCGGWVMDPLLELSEQAASNKGAHKDTDHLHPASLAQENSEV